MRFKSIAFLLLLFLSSGAGHAWDLAGVEIHGFASAGYMKSDENNFLMESEDGSYDFNEVAVNFSRPLTRNLRIGFQLYVFDLGNIGDHAVTVDWGFLDYQWKNWVGIRVGKVKTPYGLYNEVQDYDMLRTSVLLPQSIYSKYEREVFISFYGFDLYGHLSLGKAGSLGYDIFVGDNRIKSDGGVAKVGTNFRPNMTFDSMDVDWLFGGRLRWHTPVEGLQVSISYIDVMDVEQKGTISSLKTVILIPHTRGYLYSLEYSVGDFTAAVEYNYRDLDSTVTTDLTPLGLPVLKTDEKRKRDAYYALVSYRFACWFEAGVYYSVFYNDRDDHHGRKVAPGEPDYSAWQKDLAFSTRFDINDNWLLKLEVHFMDGVAHAYRDDNPDGWGDRHWTLFAAKVTYSF